MAHQSDQLTGLDPGPVDRVVQRTDPADRNSNLPHVLSRPRSPARSPADPRRLRPPRSPPLAPKDPPRAHLHSSPSDSFFLHSTVYPNLLSATALHRRCPPVNFYAPDLVSELLPLPYCLPRPGCWRDGSHACNPGVGADACSPMRPQRLRLRPLAWPLSLCRARVARCGGAGHHRAATSPSTRGHRGSDPRLRRPHMVGSDHQVSFLSYFPHPLTLSLSTPPLWIL